MNVSFPTLIFIFFCFEDKHNSEGLKSITARSGHLSNCFTVASGHYMAFNTTLR